MDKLKSNGYTFICAKIHKGPLACYKSIVLEKSKFMWDPLDALIEKAHSSGLKDTEKIVVCNPPTDFCPANLDSPGGYHPVK